MLKTLVQFSLRFRGVIILLACIVTGYGLYTASHARLDVFPNFVQPQVAIQTECPGLSPEQVELRVTAPIEKIINGLTGMESLRSESIEGLSIINVVFSEGSDVFRARQMLAEKIAESLSLLPSGVKAPRMTPLTSSTMDLLKIGLVSEQLTGMQLRTFADWVLRPRMLSVPGVAKCSSFGGEVRQLQVQVNPDRLRAHNLTLGDVVTAARQATTVRGAGFIETSNQRITLQTESGALTAAELANVVVAYTNGLSVRVGEVARVLEAAEPKYGEALIQGRPGVLLTMSSQYGANTLEVTRALEAALEEMKPLLAENGITLYPRLHRPATFIETALANVRHSLLLGAALVAVVLFLLLGSTRTALISLTAIPLSLLIAVLILEKLGVTINTITLGGLAIALGEVVDDSIIDVENIFRRLRENRACAQPRPILQVVLDASLEVRHAVVYATFIVTLVFVPVLTLTGLQGSFFAPLALSYILAILASLLVAMTVTPALAYVFYAKGVRRAEEPTIQRWLKRGYLHILAFIARWPKVVIFMVIAGCVLTAARLPFLEGEFLPEFREGHFVLQVRMAPGTSLEEMIRVGRRISAELLNNKLVATVEQQIGRAELGEDPWGPDRSEFHVELKAVTGEQQDQAEREIRELLATFPGVSYEVLTFLGDRIGETLTGETAPVVVNLFGDNLDVLDRKAKEIARVLSGVAGSEDVLLKAAQGSPRMNIRLRMDQLALFGFRPADVFEAVQTAYQGSVVAQVHNGEQAVDVAVILDPDARRDPETIGSLMLANAAGQYVTLASLADVYPATGRNSILHEGARRRQTVTCGVAGRDIGAFVADARTQIAAKVSLPAGTYAVFSGAAQARAAAQQELLLNSAAAAVGILLLLWIAVRSWPNLLLILLNVPFALVGGVLAIVLFGLLTGQGTNLSLGALVGFVTLFGISTRNSLMMISHFEHLVRHENAVWGTETVLRGASERLLPILITASVTGLALLPLALGSGDAGREIEGPMAIVILGGLVTSTLLNLLVLPTLALKYARFNGADTEIARRA